MYVRIHPGYDSVPYNMGRTWHPRSFSEEVPTLRSPCTPRSSRSMRSAVNEPPHSTRSEGDERSRPRRRRRRYHEARNDERSSSPFNMHREPPPSWVTSYQGRPAGMSTSSIDSPYYHRMVASRYGEPYAPFWRPAGFDSWALSGSFGRSTRFTDEAWMQTGRQSHLPNHRGCSSWSPNKVNRL